MAESNAKLVNAEQDKHKHKHKPRAKHWPNHRFFPFLCSAAGACKNESSNMADKTFCAPSKHTVENVEIEDEVGKDDANDSEVCCSQAGSSENHQVTSVSTQEVELQQTATANAAVKVQRPFMRSSYTTSVNDQYGTVAHEDFETWSEEVRKFRALYRRLTNPAV